jgi:hypothetical protein
MLDRPIATEREKRKYARIGKHLSRLLHKKRVTNEDAINALIITALTAAVSDGRTFAEACRHIAEGLLNAQANEQPSEVQH